MHDVDPERVAALVDGDTPRDERERALVALLRDLGAGQPAAPGQLRDRILAQAAAPPRALSQRERLTGWLRGPAAVPALATTAMVLVGVAVLLSAGGPGEQSSPRLDSAATAVPEREDATPNAVPAPTGEAPEAAATAADPQFATEGSAAARSAGSGSTTAAADALTEAPAGGPIPLRAGPAGWPVAVAVAVVAPVRRLGGVLQTATQGQAADGRSDLRLTLLVPSARADEARAVLGAVLPAASDWTASGLARQPVSASVQRRLRSSEAAWRDLGDDPAEIVVVVVQDEAP